jgi:hypothetical protein
MPKKTEPSRVGIDQGGAKTRKSWHQLNLANLRAKAFFIPTTRLGFAPRGHFVIE